MLIRTRSRAAPATLLRQQRGWWRCAIDGPLPLYGPGTTLDADLQLRLDGFDGLPLECDGMTRVIHFALREAGVRHVVKVGLLLLDEAAVVPIHYWIELEDGVLVDYRARMWAGDLEHVPHGVFRLKDFPRVAYVGRGVDLPVPRFVFEALTRDRSA